MEWRQLRALVEVIRAGGFSQAARVLNLTQSAVSKSVRQLEEELDISLIDRTARSVKPTGAGEIVFRHAKGLLEAQRSLITELDEVRWLGHGTLRLGLQPLAMGVAFAPTFAAFREAYPNINIKLVEDSAPVLAEMLHEGELELASQLIPFDDAFQADANDYDEVRFFAVMTSDHPLSESASVSFADLASERLILFAEGFALADVLYRAFEDAGLKPDVVARSRHVDFMMDLALHGMGVAIIPNESPANMSEGLHAVPINSGEALCKIAFVSRKGCQLSHAARAWLALWREHKAEARQQAGLSDR
jgi:DNA-binding transcriptional LysR family regulator